MLCFFFDEKSSRPELTFHLSEKNLPRTNIVIAILQKAASVIKKKTFYNIDTTASPSCRHSCSGRRSLSGATGRKWPCPCASRWRRWAAAPSGHPEDLSKQSCCRIRLSASRRRSAKTWRILFRRSEAGRVERSALPGCRRGRRKRPRGRLPIACRTDRLSKTRPQNWSHFYSIKLVLGRAKMT